MPTARSSLARSCATAAPLASLLTTRSGSGSCDSRARPSTIRRSWRSRPDVLTSRERGPLEAARRELAEEIGRGAGSWEPILTYYSGAGFTDERVHLFLATDLHEASAESEENERIEIVPWPLDVVAGGDRSESGRKDAHRPALARSPPERLIAPPRSPHGRGEASGMSTVDISISSGRGGIEPLILDFLAYLELERGLSRNTLDAYRCDLQQFGDFLERRAIDACQAQHGDLAAFLSELSGATDGTELGGRRGERASGAHPRPLPRSGARSPACVRSTATCAARARSSTIPPPSCADGERASACRASLARGGR